MKRDLGIARCGLACCLCSENDHCSGYDSGDCHRTGFCENRPCSMDRGIGHCYECNEECKKGMLTKIKPYGFTTYIKRYGESNLLDCLERNEKAGVVYHHEGIIGDYVKEYSAWSDELPFVKAPPVTCDNLSQSGLYE